MERRNQSPTIACLHGDCCGAVALTGAEKTHGSNDKAILVMRIDILSAIFQNEKVAFGRKCRIIQEKIKEKPRMTMTKRRNQFKVRISQYKETLNERNQVKSVFQTKYIRELFLSFFSSALDEGDIEILKTYVSFTTYYYYRNLSC